MTKLDEQLKAIQLAREKEAILIKNKIEKFLAKAKCHTGKFHWEQYGANYYISIENDGKLSDDIVKIVKTSPMAVIQSTLEACGSYMWVNDKYTRPCSVVIFTF